LRKEKQPNPQHPCPNLHGTLAISVVLVAEFLSIEPFEKLLVVVSLVESEECVKESEVEVEVELEGVEVGAEVGAEAAATSSLTSIHFKKVIIFVIFITIYL
jgi:hypothetical protein